MIPLPRKAVAQRLAWTVLAAAGGALLAVPTLDVTALRAAGMAGLVAGINAITLIARRNSLPEESSHGL